MTFTELAEKYGSHEKAIRAFLSGEMTDEEELETIWMKFAPLPIVVISHKMIMERLDRIENKLKMVG